ncbi:MAG: phosphopantothenoylcysteine decarboxylase [Spirochaeta sp.]|nr:phosphopantothenoylcysteine decarboxylase [Spirochaeta sp.]
MLAGKKVLLGVTGGIAAYQAADLIGLLRSRLVDVRVIMTEAATKFITPLTLETISQHKVTVDMFTGADNSRVEHIALARYADIFLVAPATANFIGKVASGIADDMLTTTFMASNSARGIICPAMNEGMWNNPVVKENTEKLRRHGYRFVEPEYGEMACGGEGWGRLAALSSILQTTLVVAGEVESL